MENFKELMKLLGLEVSFVDKGANGENFALVKGDKGTEPKDSFFENMLDNAAKALQKAFKDFKENKGTEIEFAQALGLAKEVLTKANIEKVIDDKKENAVDAVHGMIKELEGALDKPKADVAVKAETEPKAFDPEVAFKMMNEKIDGLLKNFDELKEKDEKTVAPVVKTEEDKEKAELKEKIEALTKQNEELSKKIDLTKSNPSALSKADNAAPVDKKNVVAKKESEGFIMTGTMSIGDHLPQILGDEYKG